MSEIIVSVNQDEGVDSFVQTEGVVVDFTADSIIIEVNDSTVFVNMNNRETEIDFGDIPTMYKNFEITDEDVYANSKVYASQAGNAPTGRSADENEMDAIIFSCKSDEGKFILQAFAQEGPVVGKYKVNYQIA